jgi:hypothetical protein
VSAFRAGDQRPEWAGPGIVCPPSIRATRAAAGVAGAPSS